MPTRFFHFLLLACFACIIFACKKNDTDPNETYKQDLLANYADIVYAGYQDSYNAAEVLKTRIDEFVAAPTADRFQACKDAWLAARIPYGQTEAFRFYGGPIDDADGPEGLINAWPIDEHFVDYVQGDPTAGLINNPALYPDITAQVLTDLNESISEESIFTGWHAIEFLLWGQDFSTSGPGTRPYTDYVSGAGGTAAHAERRGQYLQVIAGLLLEHLGTVRDEWKPDGAYRHQFLHGTETAVALGHLIASLGQLSKGELAGERMFVAIDTKDQENEHSCFSDNTVTDIRMNFRGIHNVYFGTYTRTDGTSIGGASLDGLADRYDRARAEAARTAFLDVEPKIEAIPAPFDQTIVNNVGAVTPAIDGLRALSDRTVDVGTAVGAEF